MFCGAGVVALAVRAVRRDEKAVTTLALLAECFEQLGGVPRTVLTDRMGCLKGGVVPNVVVPTADYVRFATHYGFRADFCEAADPETKGMVEALCGYVQRDLVVPTEGWDNVDDANDAAKLWCAELNGRRHADTQPSRTNDSSRNDGCSAVAVAAATVARGEWRKVDKLSTVRFGSARYSVPRVVGAR